MCYCMHAFQDCCLQSLFLTLTFARHSIPHLPPNVKTSDSYVQQARFSILFGRNFYEQQLVIGKLLTTVKWSTFCVISFMCSLLSALNRHIAMELGNYIRVLPCHIYKEFWVTSRILTKLGVFVVPMVLTTHANFWPHTSHSFWFVTTNVLNFYEKSVHFEL